MHDLAESLVGDITPYCGISKEEKKKKEMDAMQEIANLIEPRGKHLMELFLVSKFLYNRFNFERKVSVTTLSLIRLKPTTKYLHLNIMTKFTRPQMHSDYQQTDVCCIY